MKRLLPLLLLFAACTSTPTSTVQNPVGNVDGTTDPNYKDYTGIPAIPDSLRIKVDSGMFVYYFVVGTCQDSTWEEIDFFKDVNRQRPTNRWHLTQIGHDGDGKPHKVIIHGKDSANSQRWSFTNRSTWPRLDTLILRCP